ncbi:hypothetical protein BDB01DRAFT_784279 [Pilobolus umbonatus]|nr:hypothetical protein BDB01DRAFT_784279 [Pilobolus umbonatus]
MDSSRFVRTPQPDVEELIAKIISLLASTLLSTLFGLKTYNVHYKYLTYSRWLILMLYFFSWAFTTISILLVTTNNGNFKSCLLSIMVCDTFYSATKITIFAWLIEKVYIVSSIRQTRWRSKAYRFHTILMLPYIGIFTLMILFHVSEIEDSGVCIIGLEPAASLPLLIYDFLINLYMTILFIRPLMKLDSGVKYKWKASRLNEVALRTLVASVVCLIASFTNIFSLVMLDGRERGLVCLTCCTVDVTINVCTIHWVTSQAPGKRVKESNVNESAYDQQSTPEKLIPPHIISAGTVRSYLEDDMSHFDDGHDFVPFGTPDNALPSMYNSNNRMNTRDNHFFESSIHELQSSQKSLTG